MILGEDPKHDPLISRIVSFSLVCPIRMPAALRRPQQKHTPGILEHVSFVFCRFLLLLAWCAQSACLWRFGDLRKNTLLEFWSMYLVCFTFFCCFLVSGVSFGCYLVAICWFWARCFDNWSLHVDPYKQWVRTFTKGFKGRLGTFTFYFHINSPPEY